jgi:uncharacterized protein YjiS (DUF1127 family)
VAAIHLILSRKESLFQRGVHALALWLEKRESRRVLHDLSDDQLQDIGLTRREARTETAKSFFWD